MKRLIEFPLRAPHHPAEVFVIAEDHAESGYCNQFEGITVWKTDPDAASVVDSVSTPPHVVGSTPSRGRRRAAWLARAADTRFAGINVPPIFP